ncbi:hypothetical protein MTO96_023302 [Rhipicephalus appendiculatus]
MREPPQTFRRSHAHPPIRVTCPPAPSWAFGVAAAATRKGKAPCPHKAREFNLLSDETGTPDAASDVAIHDTCGDTGRPPLNVVRRLERITTALFHSEQLSTDVFCERVVERAG